ncbi:MAG TPA: hypothetical protein PK029_02525 [Bacteroidales bacterium]|nr:MAG: hypothetical protein BWY22_00176 [Bacteroidetes bacterium ADurb.Bin217]HOS85350.1 hypothetical protein [Bacteroidales bacterium]HPH16019.1 hypothetical protein [Bacteroidales bacterium]HPM12200.1 hypothetical protein [Bacteroidales bacterium]
MANKDVFFLRILEISWIIISISSLLTAIHSLIYNGLVQETIMFFAISLMAFAMFLYRRNKRKQIK